MKRTKLSKKHKPDTSSGLVTGALCLLFFGSAIWAILVFSMSWTAAVVALDIENYRPARYVVEKVVYVEHDRPRKGQYDYYAEGRVDGQFTEQFGLPGVAPVLFTLEALEQHFKQKPVVFDVMYNPKRTTLLLDNASMRVQLAVPDFVENHQRIARWTVTNLLGSIIVAVSSALYLRRRGLPRT